MSAGEIEKNDERYVATIKTKLNSPKGVHWVQHCEGDLSKCEKILRTHPFAILGIIPKISGGHFSAVHKR
jgi:hypothetical protein